MPEFKNREEYEKWKASRTEASGKTEGDDDLRDETEWQPKLISCPTCYKSISQNAQACPKCGEMLTEGMKQKIIKKEQEQAKKLKKALAIIAIIIVSLAVLGKFLSEPSEKTSASENASPFTTVSIINVGGGTIYEGQSYDAVQAVFGQGYLVTSSEDPFNPKSLRVIRQYHAEGKTIYVTFCRRTVSDQYVVCTIEVSKEERAAK